MGDVSGLPGHKSMASLCPKAQFFRLPSWSGQVGKCTSDEEKLEKTDVGIKRSMGEKSVRSAETIKESLNYPYRKHACQHVPLFGIDAGMPVAPSNR